MMSAHELMLGALAALSGVAGLFFLRYWRLSGDRLFIFFAAAFWMMGINWGAVAAIAPTQEYRHYFYLFRLVAFVLIAVAIIDKNRKDR
jgi:hypothetical protein